MSLAATRNQRHRHNQHPHQLQHQRSPAMTPAPTSVTTAATPALTTSVTPLHHSLTHTLVHSSVPSDITLGGVLSELSLGHHRVEQIQANLASLSQQHSQLIALIAPTLQSLSPTITDTGTAVQSLTSQLTVASLSAQSLSYQVRSLDSTQSRVSLTLARIQSLLTIKSSIESVRTHRAAKDYNACVRELHRVLYTQSLLTNDANVAKLRMIESEVRDELVTIIHSKSEPKEILALARLLTFVNRAYDGLVVYCQTARKMLVMSLTSKALTLKTQPAGAIISFSQLLTSHLDLIAYALKSHLSVIQASFGHGTQLRLLQEIQRECDEELSPLLRRFIGDRKLVAICHAIKQSQSKAAALRRAGGHSKSSSSVSGNMIVNGVISISDDEVIDSLTLDRLLNEIAYMARESQLFDINMRTLAANAINALKRAIDEENTFIRHLSEQNSNDQSLSSSANSKPVIVYHVDSVLQSLSQSDYGSSLIIQSSLNEVTQELLSHYLSFEHHYLSVNIDKAIRIDSHDSSDSVMVGNGGDGEENDSEVTVKTRGGDSGGVRKFHSTVSQQLSGLSSNVSQAVSAATNNASTGLSGIGIVANDSQQSLPAMPIIPPTINPSFLQRFRLSLTSTLVDDFFFIAQKVIDRAFTLNDWQSIVAMINHVNTALIEDYHAIILHTFVDYEKRHFAPTQRKLIFNNHNDFSGRQQSLLSLHAPLSTLTTAQRKLHDDFWLIVAVNDLDVSVSHLLTLIGRVQQQFSELTQSPQSQSQSQSMQQHVMDELSSTHQSLIVSHGRALSLMLNLAIVPFKRVFDSFATDSYELSEMNYSDQQSQLSYSHTEPFVAPLVASIRATMFPLSAALTRRNYESLLSRFLHYLARKIESLVWKKKFTLWGALKIDRELREISAFFSAIPTVGPAAAAASSATGASSTTLESELGVRDKLMRLIQMSSLLQLDRLNEASEIYNPRDAMLWRIDEDEVRRTLALRAEFSAKDIQALKF